MGIYKEVQCDGLIGPTHNYSGLSFGNIASESNAADVAYPRQAALQGLEKMRFVHQLGCVQVILPPPARPNLALMERCAIGFEAQAGRLHHGVQRAAWSASTMWSANAATVSPAPDVGDGGVHMTIANLASSLHRSQEAPERYAMMERIFGGVATIHPALAACSAFTDEGAANHMRLSASHGQPGVEIFVYGKDEAGVAPKRYPARQTKLACEAVAHMHGLQQSRCIITQQHPDAIDAGVFHNDVIAMSNEEVLIYHERTFHNEAEFLEELHAKADFPLTLIRVSADALPMSDAVKSYFYNSQLLSVGEGQMVIVAPMECRDNAAAYTELERIKAADDNPIIDIHYLDVRESMRNGGGPACLRLRIVLEEAQIAALPAPFIFSDARYEALRSFISTHYPQMFRPSDIHNEDFAHECLNIHERLMQLFTS